MDIVIEYDKTYQQRLLDYVEIFTEEGIGFSDVKKVWSLYLKDCMDASGWQAIWKIPRLKCEELNISYPTSVLVLVNNVNYYKLVASVRVLAVQDKINLNENQKALLKHLWPTKQQDQTVVLNLETTATALDSLRFFYQNLVMPWDSFENSSSWVEQHLEDRLHLYYDMKNGAIKGEIQDHLQCLLDKARRFFEKVEQIETANSCSDMRDDLLGNYSNDTIIKLSELNVLIKQLQCEVEWLEKEGIRDNVMHFRNSVLSTRNTKEFHHWIVFKEYKYDDFMYFLSKLKMIINKDTMKFCPSLEWVLKMANTNDVIILSPSVHLMSTLANLSFGGSMIGICSNERSTVTVQREDILFDCNSGRILLENLQIQVGDAFCGVFIRKSQVTLKNCLIIDEGKSSIHQGIIVLPGAKLEMIDCELSQLSTGINGESGSTISLRNCKFIDLKTGMKIQNDCNLEIENCIFMNNKDAGIFFEMKTESNTSHNQLEGFEILDSFKNIKASNLTGIGNNKDVIIYNKPKLNAIPDLFSNSKYMSTKKNVLSVYDEPEILS